MGTFHQDFGMRLPGGRITHLRTRHCKSFRAFSVFSRFTRMP